MAGNMSDLIEDFLMSVLAENETLELSRSELANHFSCVPSQINYVLATRFTLERGFVVDSRRGGGGFITIERLPADGLLAGICEGIGDSVDAMTARKLIGRLCEEGILTEREKNIMSGAVSDKSIPVAGDLKNVLRAGILKNMLAGAGKS